MIMSVSTLMIGSGAATPVRSWTQSVPWPTTQTRFSRQHDPDIVPFKTRSPAPFGALSSGKQCPRAGKAASLGCDSVILDLEDSVAPGAKDEAREAVRAFFKDGRAAELPDRHGKDHPDQYAVIALGRQRICLPRAAAARMRS
jgi:hypothetical protein